MKSHAGASAQKTKLRAKRPAANSRFAELRGARQTGKRADEIMNLLRGYGEDALDPGFKAGKK